MADTGAAAFAAMSDPTRRSILQLLSSHGELAVGALAEQFPDVTRAAVSAHLRVLRGADMVTEQRRGQFRYYSLGPNRAEDVVEYLRSVYENSVDDFVRAAEARD